MTNDIPTQMSNSGRERESKNKQKNIIGRRKHTHSQINLERCNKKDEKYQITKETNV